MIGLLNLEEVGPAEQVKKVYNQADYVGISHQGALKLWLKLVMVAWR